jgi:hypothetical protein
MFVIPAQENWEFDASLGYLASLFLKKKKKKQKTGWTLVAYVCDPSYSESSDQKDCGSKPALGK